MTGPSPRPRPLKPIHSGNLDLEDERTFDFLIRREQKYLSSVIRTHGATDLKWQGYRCVIATVPDDQLDRLREVVPFRHLVYTIPGLDYSCSFLMIKDEVYDTFEHGHDVLETSEMMLLQKKYEIVPDGWFERMELKFERVPGLSFIFMMARKVL